MSKKIFYLFFLTVLSTELNAQWYFTSVLPELEDQALIDQLVVNYKPTTVLDYGAARDVLYSEIYNVNDTVAGIYTNHKLYLDPSEEPRPFLFMDGAANGINCEHSYPRSKGAENGNARSDMHHLFPSRVFVNNARSSKPFGEIQDQLTEDWFFQQFQQSSIPNPSQIDLYSENNATHFEPRESIKGNIARAIMYFYTMYRNEANAADPTFFELQRETLCQWHILDPVDSLEYFRSFAIGEYQNGNPNPFVLDCSVATRTFCQSFMDEQCAQTVSTKEIKNNFDFILYPNPNQERLNLKFEESVSNLSVEIYSSLGKILLSKNFERATTLGLNHQLDKGLYFVKIKIDQREKIKPFVVK